MFGLTMWQAARLRFTIDSRSGRQADEEALRCVISVSRSSIGGEGPCGERTSRQTDGMTHRSPGQGCLHGWCSVITTGTDKGLADSYQGASILAPQGACEVKMPRRAFATVRLPQLETHRSDPGDPIATGRRPAMICGVDRGTSGLESRFRIEIQAKPPIAARSGGIATVKAETVVRSLGSPLSMGIRGDIGFSRRSMVRDDMHLQRLTL
jgi:hypothetical protein